ncbi:circadian clock protein KaiC [Streptomyces sp. NPDC020490]|uniref:circadian clock protein KaiC n=1 Tax=Streptomyces sp. NPDC020490 TaxID=3365078 RepID=UPI00378BEFA7
MNGIDAIERLPTGIRGFDPVALGGLPKGRATLVTGTTGSGKTLFAVEFLARGILHREEPGVFVTFEETAEDIRRNFAALGFPIRQWEDDGKWMFVDASADIALEAPVIGTYDFGALEARIGHAAGRIGAARISVDALDALFTRFADPAIVRHEIARMIYDLEMTGATSIITAERSGEHDGMSRYGVEEFVVDNVITLRNVLANERRRRTVEIVKFRGAPHRTGEWLFAIDPTDGLVVIPLAFLALPLASTSRVRVSSGLTQLDEMCGGGFYKDAVIVVTGPSGVGKTLLCLKFIDAAVAAGERCLVCSFEDAREQIKRNAAGWGMDIDAMEAPGLLRIIADYPETASLEDHFIRIRRAIEEHEPDRLVVDTISALERIASSRALLDFILALSALARQRGITTLFTSAPPGRPARQLTPPIAEEIASLTDVTITLRYFERPGEIHRAIVVTQTRGSAHDPGIRLVTIDSGGMHIGQRLSARIGILTPDQALDVGMTGTVEAESHRHSDE